MSDMSEYPDDIVNTILRGILMPFSLNEFLRFLKQVGISASSGEAEFFLRTHPFVFQIGKKTFLTRAGAFTNAVFAIKPTQFEVRNKILFIGDRCMPFIDPEQMPSTLKILFRNEPLKTRVMEIDRSLAMLLYQLMGEEYASQYVAAEPENKGIDLAATDFELPPVVNLTGFSIEPIVEAEGFSAKDRLLLRVIDWNEGVLEIEPLISDGANVFVEGGERIEWFEKFEKFLLENFDSAGPCSSMEEQLARVFAGHRDELCVRNCGSVEEFLDWSKKIEIAYFGVESRLWRRGEEIPAVGDWNKIPEDDEFAQMLGNAEYGVPEFIVDSFIIDMLYQKSDDISALIEKIFPSQLDLLPHERKRVMLQLKERNGIIKKHYNWFADFDIGVVRHRALELYVKVNDLIYDVDCASVHLEHFPQNQLVILSQLFGHLSHILQSLFVDENAAAEDKDAIMLSLEGMEYNFEEIYDDIAAAVEESKKRNFTVK